MDRILTEAREAIRRLTSLREMQTKQLSQLKRFDGLILLATPVKGTSRNYYYLKHPGTGKKLYLGTSSNDTVRHIQETRYLRMSINKIDTDLRLLSDLLSGYHPVDFESVRMLLPKTYRSIPTAPAIPFAPQAKEWLEEKLAYKAQFPVKYPEGLKIRAVDGTMVRSKSEALISNLLYYNNIPYVYELPHFLNDIEVRTDFTALSIADYETERLLEHQGLLGEEEYDALFLRKLKLYISAGYTPNLDVFFTFDDLSGGIDTLAIQMIIDRYLK